MIGCDCHGATGKAAKKCSVDKTGTIKLACPICNALTPRKGCPVCKGHGLWRLGQCPYNMLAGDPVWNVRRAAMLAARGSWPKAGGWLDQAAPAVAAIRAWWSYEPMGV